MEYALLESNMIVCEDFYVKPQPTETGEVAVVFCGSGTSGKRLTLGSTGTKDVKIVSDMIVELVEEATDQECMKLLLKFKFGEGKLDNKVLESNHVTINV